MKAHFRVDSRSKLIHTVQTTPANVADSTDSNAPADSSVSARLQALGLVHCRGLGIREKVDQRLCCDWLL